MIIPKYSAGGFLVKALNKGLKAGSLSYKGLRAQAKSFSKSAPELKNLLGKFIKTSQAGQKLSHEDGQKLIDLLAKHKGNYKSLNQLIPKNWEKSLAKRDPEFAKKLAEKATSKSAEQTATKAVENSTNEAAERAVANSQPSEELVAAVRQVLGTPEGQAVAAIKPRTLSSIWGKTKTWANEHPLLSLGVPALTLGTGVGRWALDNTLAAIQWSPGMDTSSTAPQGMTLRLNDGSIVPVTMGEDGVLSIGSPSTDAATGADPTDAAIAQAIQDLGGSSDTDQTGYSAPTDDSVGSYATNADLNDIFEDDAWDQ